MDWITIGILLFIYFFPFIVAGAREAVGVWGVFVLNLFLGWTLLGWIIALAWAAGGAKKPKT